MRRSLIAADLEYQRHMFFWETYPEFLSQLGLKYETAGIILALAVQNSRSWGRI